MIDDRDKAIEMYISRVLDKEFEFITENQVIPLVVDNKPHHLFDYYVFPEDGVCNINQLKEVLVCNLGDDLLKIDYDGTLKVIRNVKEIAKALLDTGESHNSLLVNIKDSSGVHNLFFQEARNEKIISDLLLYSEFLSNDLDILNISFNYLDYLEKIYLTYVEAMSTKHFEFMLNSHLIPIIVTDDRGHGKEWTVHIHNDTKITTDINCLRSEIMEGLKSIDEVSEFIDTNRITDFINKSDELLKYIGVIGGIDGPDFYTIEIENSGKINVKRNRVVLVEKLLNLYVKGIKVLDVY